MKIDPIKATGMYDAQLKAGSAKKVSSSIQGQNKTDRIEISAAGTELSQKSKIINDVAKEINKPVSPERIAQLKDQINSGNYKIPSDQIAEAMMKNK